MPLDSSAPLSVEFSFYKSIFSALKNIFDHLFPLLDQVIGVCYNIIVFFCIGECGFEIITLFFRPWRNMPHRMLCYISFKILLPIELTR